MAREYALKITQALSEPWKLLIMHRTPIETKVEIHVLRLEHARVSSVCQVRHCTTSVVIYQAACTEV